MRDPQRENVSYVLCRKSFCPGKVFWKAVASLLAPVSSSSSHPAGTCRLSLLFWHFLNPAPGILLHRGGRVEVSGSVLFYFLKHYFCSFAKRKESSGSYKFLAFNPQFNRESEEAGYVVGTDYTR